MSPVELSSSTSDSSPSSSSSKSSPPSTDSSFDSSNKKPKRKIGNRHDYTKSRSKCDKMKNSVRKSVDSDTKRRRTSSASQNRSIGKLSGDRISWQKESPTFNRRRDSVESHSSSSKFTICDTHHRDGNKTVANNHNIGNNSRTNWLSIDHLQVETSSVELPEGRFSEIIEKTKNNSAASSSKGPTLNELESFLASLKAAKSAKKSN